MVTMKVIQMHIVGVLRGHEADSSKVSPHLRLLKFNSRHASPPRLELEPIGFALSQRAERGDEEDLKALEHLQPQSSVGVDDAARRCVYVDRCAQRRTCYH